MKDYEARARALAKAHGIEVTPEHLGHDGPAVEVWSRDAHLSEPNSYCHTAFGRGETWAGAWGDVLDYLETLTVCPEDCDCYAD